MSALVGSAGGVELIWRVLDVGRRSQVSLWKCPRKIRSESSWQGSVFGATMEEEMSYARIKVSLNDARSCRS